MNVQLPCLKGYDMSIWVFGDTHGDLEISKIGASEFPESKELGSEDYVIICGDFGFPFLTCEVMEDSAWSPMESVRSARKTYRYWMRWMANKPFSVLFVLGNHENYDYWESIPTESWHGGRVRRSPDAPNVMNLVTGDCFEIDGFKIWVFGGAVSHDRYLRQEGRDWCPQEVPSVQVMEHGLKTLEENDFKVDYILTHTMPRSQMISCGINRIFDDPVASYLDEVYDKAQFRRWYCGHFHMDKVSRSKDANRAIHVLYDEYRRLGEEAES